MTWCLTEGTQMIELSWDLLHLAHFRNQPYHGDRSFRLRVLSLTSLSPTSYVDPQEAKRAVRMYMLCPLNHDIRRCDTHVYTSFFQPLIRRFQAVTELTQLVRETTSKVCEQDVGETTRAITWYLKPFRLSWKSWFIRSQQYMTLEVKGIIFVDELQ